MDEIRCKKCKSILPSTFAYCPNCGKSMRPPVKSTRRAKGTGTIYKVNEKRLCPWGVKISGKFMGYFSSQASAEEFLAQHRAGNPTALNLTLSQIWDRVQQSQPFLRLSDGSRKNLIGCWVKFAEIAHKKMRDIKTTHLQTVVDTAAENGCGRDGCAKIKSLASMLCQNAMLDDIIIRDYSESIQLPQRVEFVKRRNFTEEEIITLFYNDTDRTARITLIMIYTALRLGELFTIKKCDVNLESRYMTGGMKTEAGKNRIIPIKEEIFPYVLDFMQEPGELLIATSSGKMMHESNFRNRNFYPLLDRLGFDYKDENGRNMLTPHRTRHTYISESIAAGVKPEVLKLVVGHSSYSTSVERYGDQQRMDVIQREIKKSF